MVRQNQIYKTERVGKRASEDYLIGAIAEMVLVFFGGRGAGENLIEDVIGALRLRLLNHTSLLQEIIINLGADNLRTCARAMKTRNRMGEDGDQKGRDRKSTVKVDLDELTEA